MYIWLADAARARPPADGYLKMLVSTLQYLGYDVSPPMIEKQDLNIFYINLDRDVERRQTMEMQLEVSGMRWERVAAINGFDLPDWAVDYFPPSRLKPGEIGCYASHLLAMRTMLKRNLSYALILEDDSRFDAEAIEVAQRMLAALPERWDMVHLNGDPRAHPYAFRPLIALGEGRSLVRYSRVPPSMAAYLLSANGARKFLTDRPRVAPVDHDSRMPWHWDLDVYGVEPGPFRRYKHSSAINSLGGHSRLRRGLRGVRSGIRSPQSAAFNIRKLGFAWWIRCLILNTAHRTVRIIAGARLANRLLPLGSAVKYRDERDE